MGMEVRMSEYPDFRYWFLDFMAIPGDPDHHRREGALRDMRMVAQHKPDSALSTIRGLVAAMAALQQGANAADPLAAPVSGEPLDQAMVVQGAHFLDELRADAYHAADWEVFALALALEDALDRRRVREQCPDHELVLGVCR
jgi:hypothetical protein